MYRPIIAVFALFVFGIVPSIVQAQELRSPIDLPIYLSGNFGELRNNHFHSGIDFKTQGTIGKTIHAVNDGYVSRISVSPYGYGLALYINHPDSTTTVYGHLSAFNSEIAAYVKEQQYKQERFNVDLTLLPQQIPVTKGEQVALSGNTGSSGGPHLHFEIRDTQTEETLDPIPYYKTKIKDTAPPRIRSIRIYPMEGKGVVKGGAQTLSATAVEAWGEVGFAIKAFDYMNETANIYGVKEIMLTADNNVIYHSNLNRYAFSETRYLNSFTDYEEWKKNRSFYIKSFVEPGNRLRFIETQNRGILTINEPRVYHLTYKLTDAFGNTTTRNIKVIGKEQNIPQPDTTGTELFPYYSDNRFGSKGIRLTIPRGNLYKDLYFQYTVKEDSTTYAATHILHNRLVPLHAAAQLSIKIQKDTLPITKQYGIIKTDRAQLAWIGGAYRDGWIDGDIRELGAYTIASDSTPPKISPIAPAQWVKGNKFVFKITDNLSGIASYKGKIDEQFVLFEMEGKTAVISYRLDRKKFLPGKHQLELLATDACGNEATYSYPFTL